MASIVECVSLNRSGIVVRFTLYFVSFYLFIYFGFGFGFGWFVFIRFCRAGNFAAINQSETSWHFPNGAPHVGGRHVRLSRNATVLSIDFELLSGGLPQPEQGRRDLHLYYP